MAWTLPVIDVAPLAAGGPGASAVAEAIGCACREAGFFYAVGHGVDPALGARLEAVSRRFFAQERAAKEGIRMALGGRAWRGWFPLGGELTSGVPDDKEGIYFGAELPAADPRVAAGLPLHGPNLFPDVEGMRETVLAWLDEMTQLGHVLMRGIALSLGLDADWFHARYTRDPLILFRIFHYPGTAARPPGERWGVGEHTDYGVLTILKQDAVGGLEVRSPQGDWVDAPPLPDAFVCNIGDMLDRMTRGLYRSTPHRVVNRSERDRLSFPFFFDPALDARVQAIDALPVRRFVDDRAQRWDRASVHDFAGTYGDYLLAKIAKVFPELRRRVL